MVTETGVRFRRWEAMGITPEEIVFLMFVYHNEHWPVNVVRYTLRCC